jgi:sulfite dehydrogenase (cytochrome) subunit B
VYTFRVLGILAAVGMAILAYAIWGKGGRVVPSSSSAQAINIPVSQLTMREPVRQIKLEYHQPDLPPGPGHDVFATQCVICHSPLYVVNQPFFPRKVWTAEVQKMIKAYGAPITPDQEKDIINYLVSWHGREDTVVPVSAGK